MGGRPTRPRRPRGCFPAGATLSAPGRPHRLEVRTSPFQGENPGSIPGGDASFFGFLAFNFGKFSGVSDRVASIPPGACAIPDLCLLRVGVPPHLIPEIMSLEVLDVGRAAGAVVEQDSRISGNSADAGAIRENQRVEGRIEALQRGPFGVDVVLIERGFANERCRARSAGQRPCRAPRTSARAAIPGQGIDPADRRAVGRSLALCLPMAPAAVAWTVPGVSGAHHDRLDVGAIEVADRDAPIIRSLPGQLASNFFCRARAPRWLPWPQRRPAHSLPAPRSPQTGSPVRNTGTQGASRPRPGGGLPLRLGARHVGPDPLSNEGALELRHTGHAPENQLALRGRGVNVLAVADEIDAPRSDSWRALTSSCIERAKRS